MSEYKHSIATIRKKTEEVRPELCTNLIQVVIGTAPINTLEEPMSAVNKPILITSKEEAKSLIGYTSDIGRYTIMHSIYASFNQYAVAPIVVINVLDPENEKHVEAVAGKEVRIINGIATITEEGILLSKLVVSNGETDYEKGTDYVASFNDSGCLVIGVVDGGAIGSAESIHVSYSKLNPEGVTKEDIIGGIRENNRKTGIELLDEVYPETGIVPGIITAPVYSKYSEVAAVLDAKAERLYSMFNGIVFVDVDTSENGASMFDKVKEVKNSNIPFSRNVVPFWPMVKVDGYVLSFSAFAAALLQAATVANSDIPSESVDNMELKVDGICLEDGTKVTMTQDDVNDHLNAYGVVGALKLPVWKCWGNNTAAYPESKDPIDRWIKSVTMLNYLENRFKSNYLSKIGRNASYKLIESIVSEYNMELNSLAPDYIAGAEIIFDQTDNPIENIKIGHLKFRTRYADYAPNEYIENEFSYDVSILETVLGGGNNE